MTCRTHSMSWLDVLYNDVRRTPGGLVDAATFLATRRGKSLHTETLRCKLAGREGESVTLELAELLTEWMQEKAGGSAYAHDWLRALCAQHGLQADVVPALEPMDIHAQVGRISTAVLRLTALAGQVSGATADALSDGRLTATEASDLVAAARDVRALAMQVEMLVAASVHLAQPQAGA